MAIHTFTDRNESQPSGNSPAPSKELLDFDIPELQRTLKLACLLQTSLEMESVLQYFAECVQESISFNSLEYVNSAFDFNFVFGKADRHTCAYRLSIAGDNLGEMKFTRNKRFNDSEMEQLENFIYHLVYPLRNAILYQKAIRAAQLDSLTGINNRAAMDRCLERELELAHRHDHALSLMIVDVDHFKRINDNLGHSAGDAVLKTLTACMKDTMRVSDMLFRYGGEEFALVLSGTDLDGARQMGERLRAAVAAYPFVYNNKEIDITVSIGVASLGRRDSANRLFNKADSALYQAKKAGRNQVHSSAENRRSRT
jgi:diguanylate cyclase (GGDEF)-like protein